MPPTGPRHQASENPEPTDTLAAVSDGIHLAAAHALSTTGAALRPHVHLFHSATDPTYSGAAVVKYSTPGVDTHRALTDLGSIAAALNADALLINWEESSLRASLHGPHRDHPSALVIVKATLTEHILTWQAFSVTRSTSTEEHPFTIQWGTVAHLTDSSVPAPISTLIGDWRTHKGTLDPATVLPQMTADGHTITLTEEHQRAHTMPTMGG